MDVLNKWAIARMLIDNGVKRRSPKLRCGEGPTTDTRLKVLPIVVERKNVDRKIIRFGLY